MQRDHSLLTDTFRQLVSDRRTIPIEERLAALGCPSGDRINGDLGDEQLIVGWRRAEIRPISWLVS